MINLTFFEPLNERRVKEGVAPPGYDDAWVGIEDARTNAKGAIDAAERLMLDKLDQA